MRWDSKRGLLLTLLLGSGMAYYYFVLFLPQAHEVLRVEQRNHGYSFGCDLYPLWITARNLESGRRDPYGAATTAEIQRGLYGRTLDPHRPGDPPQNYRAFVYPLYSELLLLPVAILPFSWIQIGGSVVFPAMVVAGVFLWMRALDIRLTWRGGWIACILAVTSSPALEGVYALQPGLIVAALLAASMLSLRRGRLLLAGVLLAMASIKPQLVWLVAVWLVIWAVSDWKIRWPFLLGGLGAGTVLVAMSQWIQPGWFREWAANIADYRKYTEPPLAELIMGTWLAVALKVFLGVLAAVAAWRARWSAPTSPAFQGFWIWILMVTVIVVPSSVAVYDQLLLLPGILWLAWNYREIMRSGLAFRILGILSVAALGWPWISAVFVDVVSWMSPVSMPSRDLLFLPLRTAASLPFALLALASFFVLKGTKMTSGKSRVSGPAALIL